jgi:hypothetical protein
MGGEFVPSMSEIGNGIQIVSVESESSFWKTYSTPRMDRVYGTPESVRTLQGALSPSSRLLEGKKFSTRNFRRFERSW